MKWKVRRVRRLRKDESTCLYQQHYNTVAIFLRLVQIEIHVKLITLNYPENNIFHCISIHLQVSDLMFYSLLAL